MATLGVSKTINANATLSFDVPESISMRHLNSSHTKAEIRSYSTVSEANAINQLRKFLEDLLDTLDNR